jgi:hypothetical protein
VVIASTYRTEDPEFESRQGVRLGGTDLSLGLLAVDDVEDGQHVPAEVVDEGRALHLGL